jgi:hypothetical protein
MAAWAQDGLSSAITVNDDVGKNDKTQRHQLNIYDTAIVNLYKSLYSRKIIFISSFRNSL